jgi:hypothetical protein
LRLRRVLSSLAVGLALAAPLATPDTARAASDPALRWYTIETPHFRVTYHSGVELVAQHVASISEGIYETMTYHVGWTPKVKTEILLSDASESANGSAGALPYNALRLIVTAPEDMSPLGDVDDWYVELVTHEYTHVLHTDNITGLPALVNAVLGKTLAPNQVQPRWILEGLAVNHESARTSAGRLRNSMWDMFMRADVLENRVASIDQISNTVRRWPQGNLFYLYGSYFTKWIADTYGEEALRMQASDYGSHVIPWGINRSIRRATGKTFTELYPLWIASMQKDYATQAAAVRAQGLREGVRLTHHGQDTRYPRWVPDTSWPEHKGGLVYFREDQHQRPGLWALDLTRDAKGAVVRADERHADQIARTSGESYASFGPDGSVVFSSQEIYKDVYLFGDLEKMAPRDKSPYGTPDGHRTVLTNPKLRAADPAVSPDGRRIVYTRNFAGTRSIHIADVGADDTLRGERPLVTTQWLEQAFTPRWSPDGTHVAYSVWKRGGYRDIRYVDVRNGTYRDVTLDRAVDGAPCFSADGRYLYFHSDRTGISNVYAWEIATEKLYQVTNVLNGAYEPEPSPDGKTLAYVGYTSEGFDLFAMPLDPATWTEAKPYVDDHPATPAIEEKRWDVKPYNPWPTLWPRRYAVQITEGSFGRVVITSVTGTDVTGLNSIAASTTTELEKPELQGSLAYTYGRLPFDVSASVYRQITPRAGYQLGKNYAPVIVQEATGFATTLAYTRPRSMDSSSFVVSHALSRIGAEIPIPTDKLDPYETPQFPARGLASSLHLGYSFTNAERYLWSVGPERGMSFSMSVDVTHPTMGSDFEGFVVNSDFTTYWLMPWASHHSVAAHVGGGTSGGSYPGRGAFYVGSFVDLPIVDTIQNQLFQGGVTLRGYQPVAIAGRSYLLSNLEYRFPIVNIDRGPSTLPVFLNRITGAAFVDYGSAFDLIDNAAFKTGVGGELWFDSTLGYVASFTFRLGYAKGLASGGIDKVYFVAAVPF